MNTNVGDARLQVDVVNEFQRELLRILEELRELGKHTVVETWSPQIKDQYRMTLDNIAALDAYIYIYRQTLTAPTMVDGVRSDGTSAEP